MRFEDKVVIVTGAGSGIGAATADRFAAEGATVVRADIAGSDVVQCDVRDSAQVQDVVARVIAEHGGIDVLANVAGVTRLAHVGDITDEHWQTLIDVNLTGPFRMIRAALPSLIERGGTIINVGSVAGQVALPYQAAYGTSKAGLIHLTKSLAVELAPLGVRCNVVSPGTVMTPLVQKAAESLPEDMEPILIGRMQGMVPGIIDPDEIATAILYAASEDARSMTGSTITIDLGLTF